jgi:hypothetical protein
MPDYRRNRLLQEQVSTNKTFGLPLFENSDRSGDLAVARLAEAPGSVALATDTRKLSHVRLTMDEARLGENQRIVFEVIRQHGPVTNEEINRILGWNAINRVVGRTFELRHYGKNKLALVVPDIKRKCSVTGETVTPWKVNEQLLIVDPDEKI